MTPEAAKPSWFGLRTSIKMDRGYHSGWKRDLQRQYKDQGFLMNAPTRWFLMIGGESPCHEEFGHISSQPFIAEKSSPRASGYRDTCQFPSGTIVAELIINGICRSIIGHFSTTQMVRIPGSQSCEGQYIDGRNRALVPTAKYIKVPRNGAFEAMYPSSVNHFPCHLIVNILSRYT